MISRNENLNNKKFILYPILIGVLFIVNELRNNGRFYTFKENLVLISVTLLFCTIVNLLSRKIVKNHIKAALIASLFIIINLFYVDLILLINTPAILKKIFSFPVPNHPEILISPFLCLLWLFISFLIIKKEKEFLELNRYLNILISVFIFVELFKWALLPNYDITLVEKFNLSKPQISKNKTKHNIYFIILDAYTNSESLKKYWNFDNSQLEDSLMKMGFYSAHRSTSDYTSTPYCLASYLNLSLLKIDSSKLRNEKNLLYLIRNSKLEKSLKNQGYNFINYSMFDVDQNNKFYNIFTYDHFLGRTFWVTNAFNLWHILVPQTRISNTNLEIFDKLQKLPIIYPKTPYFVYAHIYMPHAPYIFNEKGIRMVNEYGKRNGFVEKPVSNKFKYLKQLRFVNIKVIKMLKQIILTDKSHPIIIIQGDHGYRFLEDFSKADRLKESYTILNAYLVPEEIKNELYDSIKPINGLKVILNMFY